MRKSIIDLTLFQSIFILTWLIIRTASWFFPALGVIVLASVGMTVYLLFRWRHLSVADRREGLFAVVGWLVIAWLVIHANGLTVGSLFS